MNIEIINKETGEVELKHECHSFVLQYLQVIGYLMKGSQTSMKDITNTARGFTTTPVTIDVFGVIGNVTRGLVVGSGTNGNSPNDYALQTLIAQGSSAGQLQYGIMSFTEAVVAGSNIVFVMQRDVTNGSGGNVTVNEIGVYFYTLFDSTPRSYCMVREELGGSFVIANGATKTVKFTINETN